MKHIDFGVLLLVALLVIAIFAPALYSAGSLWSTAQGPGDRHPAADPLADRPSDRGLCPGWRSSGEGRDSPLRHLSPSDDHTPSCSLSVSQFHFSHALPMSTITQRLQVTGTKGFTSSVGRPWWVFMLTPSLVYLHERTAVGTVTPQRACRYRPPPRSRWTEEPGVLDLPV